MEMLSGKSTGNKSRPKTLILGMGNPILSDDGVGLVLAERLKGMIDGVDVASNPMIDLSLLDDILGYEVVYLIDAMTTRAGIPGELKKIHEDDSVGTLHLFSSHGMNFFELMKLGRSLGYDMPKVGGIYGIEIGDEVEFNESLSPVIQGRIEEIVESICRDVMN
jgi:hydrogenase maturation protease